ncbi:MAG: CmpA/NrtA family ABC transporter substrate-binding protein [Candidatus Competibacteraceae bacterium]|nr:CmpA/NrtA family ABC transporter substrate-binding protein [Candidatus Competibacteraceae bacterium]
MTQSTHSDVANPAATLEKTELQLGFIPLTDCAPLVIAQENGFYAKYGLNVELVRENSWASIRDKVSYGLLDGAHMLAAMPLATSLGVGAPPVQMLTAFSLGLNGNAVTVSNELFREMEQFGSPGLEPLKTAQVLAQVIKQRQAAGREPMTFAMVFPFSSHNYLLRYWMSSAGIDPDRDVSLIVIPPPQMVRYLAAGMIDGYCVGEPWNTQAVTAGLGRVLVTSHQIWNNHPEKVFGVTEHWAEHHPQTHRAVLLALLEAARWLDQPENRPAAAAILAKHEYVDAPAAVIEAGLCGHYCYVAGQEPLSLPDFNVFHRYAANYPWTSHALWFLTQMYRWGQLRTALDLHAVARRVYRADIYRAVADSLNIPCPVSDLKTEGVHEAGWLLEDATPIVMGADRFIDSACFDPNVLPVYLESFAIEDYRVSPRQLAQLITD